MDIDTDDDILRQAAADGLMDYAQWPDLLPRLVSRIDKIAHHDFPIPNLPPPPPSPPLFEAPVVGERRFLDTLPSSDAIEPDSQPSSQETNKENTVPLAAQSQQAPVPASGPEPPVVSALRSSSTVVPDGALPPQITAMLDEVKEILTDHFAEYPPHTIQRLAELVLAPRRHYRSLPAYLHAVDRVVRVTSGANTYPLPPAVADMTSMSQLANGVSSRPDPGITVLPNTALAASINPGSDEALGGALLTPIPWLQRRSQSTGAHSSRSGSRSPREQQAQHQQPQFQHQHHQHHHHQQQLGGQVRTESTETIEGPNGMGSVETVTVTVNGVPSAGANMAQRGVTQGELLRQEQRAGVVPVNQRPRNGSSPTGEADDEEAAAVTAAAAEEEEEEHPHARGPEEIGAADMGPQSTTTSYVGQGGLEMHGIDVEAAVGRRSSPAPGEACGGGGGGGDLPGDSTSNSDRASVSTGSETLPSTPKRDAGDDTVEGGPKKRQKSESPSAEGKPKKDAEGDTVLTDAGEPVGEKNTGVTAEGGKTGEA